MILNDVLNSDPERKRRKRVGRGIGSGRGKTATRGTKGQHSRTGAGGLGLMEGGTMPLFRRLPHRGFNNARFRGVPFAIVNVSQLEARFESGATVDLAALQASGLVKKNARKVKVLGDGDLTRRFTLQVHAVSAKAREKIEAAGGTIQELK